jgi:hypothetical protein
MRATFMRRSIALTTTTVNVPHVLASYAKFDPEMLIIVAADTKTPPEAKDFIMEHCQPVSRIEFMTVEAQQDMGYKSSELIGWNTDSRRNIALLQAIKSGAEIIVSVDDDMIPCGEDFFYNIERVLSAPYLGLQCGEPEYWFDAGRYTIPPAKQRGLPADCGFVNAFSSATDVQVGAVQGIILGVPDTDAMTAITNSPVVTGATDILRNGFVVHPEALTVFNSQLTAFRRELAPAFAQFYKWQGRNTDIFASLIMRRVMRERGLHTYFGPPMAFHARSKRPLFNDLKAEMFGLEHIVEFQNCLDGLTFRENMCVSEQVRSAYVRLQKFSWFHSDCAEAALAFCDDVEGVE